MNLLKDDILQKEELCAGVLSAINDPCPELKSRIGDAFVCLKFLVITAKILLFAPKLVDKGLN